jgi:negative regulator of flagellin synthesis FlgM
LLLKAERQLSNPLKVIQMKIDNSYNPSLAMLQGKKSSASKSADKAVEGSDSSEVKLSGVASSISTSSSESSAPVNSAKIAEIRAAIASGQFKINSGAIADRLLDTAKELVQTQRRA